MNILLSVLLSILIAIFFISCVVFAALSIIKEDFKFIIGASVSFTLICICLCKLPNKKAPSELYQEKVEAVKKANKELEKFLIDYPEFRED